MYVVHGMRKLAAFRASGAEGECHEDLWRQISIFARDRTIDVRKVKSHTGVAGNETADSLAKRGRQVEPGRRLHAARCVDGSERVYANRRRNRVCCTLFCRFRAGINGKIRSLLVSAFEKERLPVSVGVRCGPLFRSERGVRTGDSVSPRLFNLVLDAVTRQVSPVCQSLLVAPSYYYFFFLIT